MATGATTFFQSLAGSAIDAEAGIIRGVSVVTEGAAKGHGVLIDATMLAQVKKCADEFASGIKVKADHRSGVNSIVGTLRNFSITGNKLTADLHVLKTYSGFAHLMEMAAQMPETFGLSLSFSMTKEKIGDSEFARCSDIYSADLVDQPAANPNGLFTAQVDNATMSMNLETFIERAKTVFGVEPKPAADSPKPVDLSADLAASKTELSAAQTKVTQLEAELTASKAAQTDFDAKVATAASAKALEITAAVGVPPVKAPVSAAQADNVKTRTEFSAMSPEAQSKFCLAGGKLTN